MDDLVVVYVSQGPLGAEVARAKLESCGVPAALRYEAMGRVLGLTIDGLGRVEVVVPARFTTHASNVLEDTNLSLSCDPQVDDRSTTLSDQVDASA